MQLSKILAAPLAASLAALAVTPAAAEPVRLTISTAGIDLASAEGADQLAQRIEARVEGACERPFIRDLKAMRDFQACVASARDVTDEALAQAGLPAQG